MSTTTRKRKTKHLKLTTIGGKATVHFGPKRVTVTMMIRASVSPVGLVETLYFAGPRGCGPKTCRELALTLS